MGSNIKEMPPKIIITAVCEVHMIQPKALLGSSGKANKRNAKTTASGYEPIPPFVAAMLKLAVINPINIAKNGIGCSASTENDVT